MDRNHTEFMQWISNRQLVQSAPLNGTIAETILHALKNASVREMYQFSDSARWIISALFAMVVIHILLLAREYTSHSFHQDKEKDFQKGMFEASPREREDMFFKRCLGYGWRSDEALRWALKTGNMTEDLMAWGFETGRLTEEDYKVCDAEEGLYHNVATVCSRCWDPRCGGQALCS